MAIQCTLNSKAVPVVLPPPSPHSYWLPSSKKLYCWCRPSQLIISQLVPVDPLDLECKQSQLIPSTSLTTHNCDRVGAPTTMRDLFLLTVLQLCLLISVSASEFASLSGDTSVSISTATASTSRKELPHQVLIGYAFSNYTNVRAAVMEDGVNVVIWAFMDIRSSDKGVDMVDPDVSLVARRDLENMNDEQVEGNTQHHHQQSTAQIKTNLDLNAISSLIQELNLSLIHI